jgi:predicted RNA-binding Zn ribbon-like protein
MFASMQGDILRDRQTAPGRRVPPLQEPTTAEPAPIEQQATPTDAYPGLGEPLAIELANTLFTDRGRPRDALTTPAGLSRWLKTNAERIGAPPPRRLSGPELERARDVRTTIRTLLATALRDDHPPAATIRHLNQLAALAPVTRHLDWPTGEPPTAQLSLSATGRLDGLLALLAQSAIDVLGGSGAGRLRRCEAPGCINYYLKDHPRRAWCSPKCGNRVRVARHYQRRRRPRT